MFKSITKTYNVRQSRGLFLNDINQHEPMNYTGNKCLNIVIPVHEYLIRCYGLWYTVLFLLIYVWAQNLLLVFKCLFCQLKLWWIHLIEIFGYQKEEQEAKDVTLDATGAACQAKSNLSGEAMFKMN